MTNKPTVNQRFAGFFALFALAFAHGRLVWIFLDALLNDVAPETFLDTGLFVWGMLLLYAVFAVAGVMSIFLALAVFGWVKCPVNGKQPDL